MLFSSIFVDYIAGVCGGVAVVLIGHPFDTTKIRLVCAPQGFYLNTFDCVAKTWKWEGLRGFYSGIGSPLTGQMFFRAVSFSTFHYSVSCISNQSHKTSSLQYFLAGGFTGFVISILETPIDLVKTKLQIQIFSQKLDKSFKPDFTTTLDCVKHIIRKNGVVSLWQGWLATAIRNIPANALFFPVNEIVKRELARRNNTDIKNLDIGNRLIAGACAGLSYWVGTYPLDVIKGRMQAQAYENRLNWIDTAQLIWKEGGLRSFTKGLGPCTARSIPACSAMFFTVDHVRESLTKL